MLPNNPINKGAVTTLWHTTDNENISAVGGQWSAVVFLKEHKQCLYLKCELK